MKPQNGSVYFLILLLLMSCGAGVKPEDENINRSLISAAYRNNSQLTMELIKNGADVNFTDSSGYSAFLWAVSNLNIDLVEKLIKKGANTHQKTASGKNALHVVFSPRIRGPILKKGNIEVGNQYAMVVLLTKLEIDINLQNENGATPAYFAAGLKSEEQNVIRILKILVENGADFSIKNSFGYGPYDAANSEQVKFFIKSVM